MKENHHFLQLPTAILLKKETFLYPQDGGLLVDLSRIKQFLVF